MKKEKEEQANYFQEALGDFIHDAASGGAIRHLLDLGYTTDGIMGELDFPTPRARVEKTVYCYLTEQKILLEELPLENMHGAAPISGFSEAKLCRLLRQYIEKNGEESSYVSCPFGTIRRDREARLQKILAPLTEREREYLMGIPWKPQVMYHRLNSRMLEISVYLVTHSNVDMKFYFLKTKEIITTKNSEKEDGENAEKILWSERRKKTGNI